MISALRWGWVVSTTPWSLYPRVSPDTHWTGGWLGTRVGLDGCGKSRLPPGFDPRTVQPVAGRYTDWAIPAPTIGWHIKINDFYIFTEITLVQFKAHKLNVSINRSGATECFSLQPCIVGRASLRHGCSLNPEEPCCLSVCPCRDVDPVQDLASDLHINKHAKSELSLERLPQVW